MSYVVRAWRARTGKRGVNIGTRTALGWDNVVAEILLIEEGEVEAFVREVRAAWGRAQTFTDGTREAMPGPYDDGWD